VKCIVLKNRQMAYCFGSLNKFEGLYVVPVRSNYLSSSIKIVVLLCPSFDACHFVLTIYANTSQQSVMLLRFLFIFEYIVCILLDRWV
jgi:hypothetical protein